MAEKETILALTTPQEISLEVLFQKEVCLEVDVPVFHVQYGRDEICRYVNDVSKPDLETYTSVKKTEVAKAAEQAVETAEENIGRYKEEQIKPELDSYVADTIKPALQDFAAQTLRGDLQNFADGLSEEFNRNAEEKTSVVNDAFESTKMAASIAVDAMETAQEKQALAAADAETVAVLTQTAENCAAAAQNHMNEAQSWASGTIAERPEGSAKYWAESVNPNNFVRPGTVIMYPLSSLEGYLICNGAAVSRTAYADLFKVLGTTYGAGDESITFNVPDFRGDFIRGYLSGTSSDIGQRQAEGLPNITGSLAVNTGWFGPSNSGCFSSKGSASATTFANACTASVKSTYTMKASASSSVYGGSSHVTPRNHALHFLIKY